jgi:hypothetical protein
MLKTVAELCAFVKTMVVFIGATSPPIEHLPIIFSVNSIAQGGKRTVSATQVDVSQPQEAISDYVAELQLHMTLQARNLVPTLTQTPGPCHSLVHESQAMVEKIVSRQRC